MKAKSTGTVLIALLLCFLAGSLRAQSVMTPENMSLGGGGTAYLTGVNAVFMNPANLMIRSRPTEIEISAGNTGFFYTPVRSPGGLGDQIDNYRSVFTVHRPGSQSVATADKQLITNRNYGENDLVSEHLNMYQIQLGGLLVQKPDRAFAVAARTRMGTRTEIGRGWYDPQFIEADGQLVRDFTLRQQSRLIHEVSFGYAQNLEIISGLIPRLNELYVGIAPKIVFSGSYVDLSSSARLTRDGTDERLSRSMVMHASGAQAEMTRQYLAGASPRSAIGNQLDPFYYTDIDDFGVGIDLGLTYVLSLGSDISLAEGKARRELLEKSLRIAVSVTDLGFVHHTRSPLTLGVNGDTSSVSGNVLTADSKYVGSPGQYIDFFDNAGNPLNPLTAIDRKSNGDFTSLLPTSFNGGFLFELNRFKLMADITLGLNDTAFNSTKLSGHFGVEVHPRPWLPLRLGTRLAKGYPTFIGLGTGVETTRVDILLSTQLLVYSSKLSSKMAGATFGGIRIHL